ncbi:MAG: PPOX class probable FMN-dependent enzyme [Gammaproteobacteria bacterium]|jgi:PPOX class probable FMN-dependent enzyme
MTDIDDASALRNVYKQPAERAVKKQLDHLDIHCRRFIELSPFVVLASNGADGRSDASPRGGPAGFVKVLDDNRLALGDSPGNNRLDTLSNIAAHPQIGLLFLIPGVDETLRVNGTARSTTDAVLLDALSIERKPPASVMVVDVHEAYLHCAKALMRSKLWDVETHIERGALPTMNQMIKDQTNSAETHLESQQVMQARYKEILY